MFAEHLAFHHDVNRSRALSEFVREKDEIRHDWNLGVELFPFVKGHLELHEPDAHRQEQEHGDAGHLEGIVRKACKRR